MRKPTSISTVEGVYDEYEGARGMIVVLDGRTRRVRDAIGGSRDFDTYRAAIDAALTDAAARVESGTNR